MRPSSDFKYAFRSPQSIANLLLVISDRIDRAFNNSGAPRSVALNIFKFSTGFGMLVFFTNKVFKYLTSI